MGKPKRRFTNFNNFITDLIAKIERNKVKRRLKAAFKRTPRPAKVLIKDDEMLP